MAITQIRAQYRGQWHTLTYNAATRRYEAELAAEATSYNEPDGIYAVTLEAINDAGASTTRDLSLTVRERVAPRISIDSPAAGYVTSTRPTITIRATDEAGGSGIDPESLTVSLSAHTGAGALTRVETTGGYLYTYTPSDALTQGAHELTATVSDHDGNTASATLALIVDTVPPTLTLRRHHVIVDGEAIRLAGESADVTAPQVTLHVVNNGGAAVEIPVAEDGAWAHTLPLAVGENRIVLTATDGAGLTTTVESYAIRLITDRTAAAVAHVKALADKGWAGMSAAEREAWSEAVQRGAYNASDLNRVATAAAWLGGELAARGWANTYRAVDIDGAGREVWDLSDEPTAPQWDAWLRNVRRVRAALPMEETPDVETVRFLGTAGANAIEAILVRADALLVPLDNSVVYSGEPLCGEF